MQVHLVILFHGILVIIEHLNKFSHKLTVYTQVLYIYLRSERKENFHFY